MPSLTSAVEELLSRHVLEEAVPARLRFVHDQIREVAYDLISDVARRELHQAAAEALEGTPVVQRDEALAALGEHWERAGFSERARDSYLAGARKAAARYGHAEAERLYRASSRLTKAPSSESIAARNELGADVLAVQGRIAKICS